MKNKKHFMRGFAYGLGTVTAGFASFCATWMGGIITEAIIAFVDSNAYELSYYLLS